MHYSPLSGNLLAESEEQRRIVACTKRVCRKSSMLAAGQRILSTLSRTPNDGVH
jgi:hypothetical protein